MLESSFDYTINARKQFYRVVDNHYFLDQDADLIFASLEENLKLITFGEYLKRYIYKRAEMTLPYEEVPLKDYQTYITNSFEISQTPKSFAPTSAKMGALAKNWLTQQTVKRNIVFLLGFGLKMTVKDVNEFLLKGIREQAINPKNPFEVICWYCYKNEYDFAMYEKLWEQYDKLEPNSLDILMYSDEMTMNVRSTMRLIHDENSLMAHLCKLKNDSNRPLLSVSARKNFDKLYDRARECIAQAYNNLAVYSYTEKSYTKDDISDSDIERIICAAVPVDKNGNLSPAKASSLNGVFAGRRFSRQRIHDILSNKSEVNRFDLITLNFFIFSQTLDEYRNEKSRYSAFIESTNKILTDCSLGHLYIANPYENFILMCILAEDPLVTYADVWEKSY